MISQEIALSFFPLNNSEFEFVVYRRLYAQDEKKSDFPAGTKRRLPVVKDSDEWTDYWVSLENDELQGFEPFRSAFT